MILDPTYSPIPDDWQPPTWLPPPEPLQQDLTNISRCRRFEIYCMQNLTATTSIVSNVAVAAFFFKDIENFPLYFIKSLFWGVSLVTPCVAGLLNWWEYRKISHLTCKDILRQVKENPFISKILKPNLRP